MQDFATNIQIDSFEIKNIDERIGNLLRSFRTENIPINNGIYLDCIGKVIIKTMTTSNRIHKNT